MPIKPGWILLALLFLYALWQGEQLSSTRRQVKLLRDENAKLKQVEPAAAEGFAFPLPGACLPSSNNLPGAPRSYRKGQNPGFVFTGENACVPVRYGTGVIASASGTVVKSELSYKELSKAEFDALLKAVKNGASPEQMDKLRGREVWIRHADGLTTVYAHLSAIPSRVKAGAKVQKGDWIGRVGNSGTELGVLGNQGGARLLFELWDGEPDKDRFFGQGLATDALKAQAKLRFGLN